MCDDVAGFEERQNRRQRRGGIANVHHDTQTRRLDDRLRTTKRLEIVFARN